MASWLLTWNPNTWDWEEYEKTCEETPALLDWSCNTKKIKIGDEVYLMKQGKAPRGIIAHGIVTEDVYQEEHWDEDKAEQGKEANYVPAVYDVLLNYKEQKILETTVLDEKCPQQFWHPLQSGISIKDEVLPTLHELWAEITGTEKEDKNSFIEESSFIEGREKFVYATKYERDPKVRKAFLKGKKLKCEVCGFDFENAYGDLGKGYIEVHHKHPVSQGVRMTDLDNDLVMLCSNCHKMIHRGRDHMITVEELKKIIERS